MGSGGHRANSGPKPLENSARSIQRGVVYESLRTDKCMKKPPEFPLPDASDRELEVWENLWTFPQAHKWHEKCYAYLVPTIALYARTFVRCENIGVAPSVFSALFRFADQIGLSLPGLASFGWKIDDVKKVPAVKPSRPIGKPGGARSRLKVVGGNE